MGRFAKHIGLGRTIKIGEEEITLKPLRVKHLPSLFELMGKFEGVKDDEIIKRMDKDVARLIGNLCLETMRLSYPNEPEEEREAFVMNHLIELLPVIIELNSFGASNQQAVKERMEQMKRAAKKVAGNQKTTA